MMVDCPSRLLCGLPLLGLAACYGMAIIKASCPMLKFFQNVPKSVPALGYAYAMTTSWYEILDI